MLHLKRDCILKVRLTADELESFLSLASKSFCSGSSLARSLILQYISAWGFYEQDKDSSQ